MTEHAMRTLGHGGAPRPDHTLRIDQRNSITPEEAPMSKIETGQVSAGAAEVCEELYLPALFLEWTPRMADAARIGAGQRVLDVACGTGVLARAVAALVGPRGSVVG